MNERYYTNVPDNTMIVILILIENKTKQLRTCYSTKRLKELYRVNITKLSIVDNYQNSKNRVILYKSRKLPKRNDSSLNFSRLFSAKRKFQIANRETVSYREIFHRRDINKPQVAEWLAFIADEGGGWLPLARSNLKHETFSRSLRVLSDGQAIFCFADIGIDREHFGLNDAKQQTGRSVVANTMNIFNVCVFHIANESDAVQTASARSKC